MHRSAMNQSIQNLVFASGIHGEMILGILNDIDYILGSLLRNPICGMELEETMWICLLPLDIAMLQIIWCIISLEVIAPKLFANDADRTDFANNLRIFPPGCSSRKQEQPYWLGCAKFLHRVEQLSLMAVSLKDLQCLGGF